MELELILETLDDLDSAFHPLYTEKDGKFVLTGVKGMKTQEDVDRLNEALRKERSDHASLRDKAKPVLDFVGDRSLEDLQAQLDEIEELKLRIESGEGTKLDEERLEKLLDQRLARKLGPVERERDKLAQQLQEITGERDQLQSTLTTGRIHETLRQAATKAKVVSSAIDDVLLYDRIFEVADDGEIVTRDGISGVQPGLTAGIWLQNMQDSRPHWWPLSEGGGARGGSGVPGGSKNPWSRDGWNLTAQGQFVREHGIEKATKAAQSVGSTIGATAPPAEKK